MNKWAAIKPNYIVGIRKNMELFSALGFHWNRSIVPAVVPTHSIERVAFRFHRMLPEFVWDASVLEGNPFTFPEVKTLLDGVTIGGRNISDQEQVLNLAKSAKHLLALVKAGKFSMDKATFTELHGLVARNEALEWGHFRGEGKEGAYTPDVGLGEHGRYTPLATAAGAPELNRVFVSGLQALQNEVQQPFEKAAAFFLFGALQQFSFDGNKRTSRFMMNGILMTAGIDAISVPAAKAQEFNENMVRFYLEKDATEMMAFLVDCHPDAEKIHEAKQNSPTTENDRGLQP
jgi:prophage maintenance system killer protein